MGTIELSFPGTEKGLDFTVRRFHVAEGLSRPFEVMLVAACPDPDLDFERVIGAPARCWLDRGPLGARVWTGVCTFIEQLEAEPGGPALYGVRLSPALWLLSQRRDHRVFSRASTPEIARALLGEAGVEVTLRLDEARFPRHEQRVQYGESDLAFLSRLLEDAGLSYAFEEQAAEGGPAPRLVLIESPERGERRPGGPIPFVGQPSGALTAPYLTDVRIGCEVRPGAVVIGDFDLHRPLYRPSYHASGAGKIDARLEHRIYAPGAAIVDGDPPGRGRSDDPQGQALAARTLEALREGRRALELSTNLIDLAPGVVFSIEGGPRPELGASLCVVSASLEGSVDGEWTISVSAVPGDAPVRPARRTPRPRVEGVQSAVVVGPREEEIHVDDLGRVLLRFPWDRRGDLHGERGPWVRVAEGWAGAGFGMITLPRVAEEVLVSFFEGDPDHPVIVGRAHDASSPPPHPLPAAGARSVWRSRSSPGSSGYHEIALDDRRRHELLLLRSERDLEKVVRHDEVEHAGEDRTAIVGGHLAATIGGDDTVEAGAAHHVAIAGGGARREIIARRITLTSGSATIQLDGPDITVTAAAGIRIQAGGTVSIQGEPHVHLNPPHVHSGGAEAAAGAPEHLVWFRLVSEGRPLSGARCRVEHEDGTSSAAQVTDGNGLVRLPVERAGRYHVKLGAPRSAPAEKPGGAAAPAVIHVGETPAQPARNAKPTEHEVPIKLEIVEPRPGTTFHTHTTPAMPAIPLEARVLVQGEPAQVGSIRWELHLAGEYRVRDEAGSGYRLEEYRLAAGHARTSPGEARRFELGEGELAGGDLEIKAVFQGGAELGEATASRSVSGCKVLGRNAPRREVEAYIAERGGHLAWLYLRMFCHESAHTLDQFAAGRGGGNAPGSPLYGPPSGVGIVQRDPTAGEWRWPKSRITRPNNFFPRIFWDWKKNVDEGITSFQSDYIERGRRDLDLLRRDHPHLPMYPEGLLLRAAIRRYNGGTEHAASADGRHYVVRPAYTNNPGYVNDVLDDPHIDAHAHPVPADARATMWPR